MFKLYRPLWGEHKGHSVRHLSVAQVLFCKNNGSVREETA